MPRTSSDYDLEILLADGVTPLGLMLARPRNEAGQVIDGAPLTLEEALAATDADAPVSESLVPFVQESWFRGVGLDYDWAPGVDTTDPEFACPAGKATNSTLLTGTNAGAIVMFAEYNGNLYAAQIGDGNANSARVLVISGGSGVPAVSLALGANEYMRGLVTADNGSGVICLYAFSSTGGITNGRVHELNSAVGTWVSTTAAAAAVTPRGVPAAGLLAGGFGTNGRGRALTVQWRGRDGVKNNTIVTQSGDRTISYLRPNADPMAGLSWIEGVKIGTAYELKDMTSSRGHVFLGAKDNLFDLDEVGNSPGITSYISEQVQPGNGDAVQYLDGSIYYSFGRGLIKINVEQDGVLSEQPGQCAPGAYLPVAGCPRGYVTAMTTDQGWLVASVFDTTTRTSSIFYGKSREQLGIESPNPMIWHGPLVYFTADYRVTRMRTSALAGDLRLWIASIDDNIGTPQLTWVSRPLAGTTIQDLKAGGAHRVMTGAPGGTVQPYSRIYGLRQSWDDKASRKDLHQHVVGSIGLDSGTGTKITIYNRADPSPTSVAWGTGVDVTASPVQTITPAETVSGYSLEQRIDLFAPQGAATPPKIPFLDSLRTTAWKIAPATMVKTLTVEYGDDVLSIGGASNATYDPDWTTAQLEALCGNRTTLRDRQDKRWSVRVRQVFARVETLSDSQPYGKQVRATLQVQVLAAL